MIRWVQEGEVVRANCGIGCREGKGAGGCLGEDHDVSSASCELKYGVACVLLIAERMVRFM